MAKTVAPGNAGCGFTDLRTNIHSLQGVIIDSTSTSPSSSRRKRRCQQQCLCCCRATPHAGNNAKRAYHHLAMQFAGEMHCVPFGVHPFDSLKQSGVLSQRIHGRVECQARRNSRNFSSVSFHEFSDEASDPNFLERLARAWHILFPPKPKPVSNAEIAKQRLKMILISDRCAISNEAKRRIVDNVVGALSNFVEIESEEKVQLNVSADPDLGTVYSVIVPVRRVKPEYQDFSENFMNFNHGDMFGTMRTLDVRFEYPDPKEE